MKVLIISEERDLVDALTAAVRFHWRDGAVSAARAGEEALALFHEQDPDVVILDMAMVGTDGLAVLGAIRRVSDAPVLALGARDSDADQVRALELGADDYVLKPFGHLALLARLNALVRRAQAAPERALPGFQIGDLRVDFASRRVWVRGRALALGEREYTLLYHLVRNTDRLLSAETLAERVWGPTWGAGPTDVKALVHRLRAKLMGPDGAGQGMIENAHGRGYRFAPPGPLFAAG